MLLELIKFLHVRVHCDNIGQQGLGLEMESFRVLDLEFESLLRDKLVQAEVHGLSKLLAQLFRHERLRLVFGNSGHQLDNHARKLVAKLGFSLLFNVVALHLLSLVLWQLIPSLLVLLEILEVLALFESQQPVKKKLVHIIDEQVAEFIEVFRVQFWQLLELSVELFVLPSILHEGG